MFKNNENFFIFLKFHMKDSSRTLSHPTFTVHVRELLFAYIFLRFDLNSILLLNSYEIFLFPLKRTLYGRFDFHS